MRYHLIVCEAWLGSGAGVAGIWGSLTYYMKISQRLGQFLLQGTNNDWLRELLASLARQTMRYRQLGLSTSERRRESASNWRKLCQAFKRKDAVTADSVARRLVRDSMVEAVKCLIRDGQASPMQPSKRAHHRAGRDRPLSGMSMALQR